MSLASSSSLASRLLILSFSFRSRSLLSILPIPPNLVGSSKGPTAGPTAGAAGSQLALDYGMRRASSKSASSKSSGGGGQSARSRAIEINKRVAALGGDWSGLLDLQEKEGGAFDKVNWATVTSRLGRLRTREMRDMKRDKRVSEAAVLLLRLDRNDLIGTSYYVDELRAAIAQSNRCDLLSTSSLFPLPSPSPSPSPLTPLTPHLVCSSSCVLLFLLLRCSCSFQPSWTRSPASSNTTSGFSTVATSPTSFTLS